MTATLKCNTFTLIEVTFATLIVNILQYYSSGTCYKTKFAVDKMEAQNRIE